MPQEFKSTSISSKAINYEDNVIFKQKRTEIYIYTYVYIFYSLVPYCQKKEDQKYHHKRIKLFYIKNILICLIIHPGT